MKQQLAQLLAQAYAALQSQGMIPADLPADIQVERTRDRGHGDFASNLAMTLAKAARRKPRDIAEALVAALPGTAQVVRVEIAGPGFINFHLSRDAWHGVVGEILDQGEGYGRSTLGQGQAVQVEFVSANPTGPLHVGHGRGAAYGATVADLLRAVGYTVHREYYVNDAGRQMDILATSVFLRYLDLAGVETPFPSNGYQGDYVWDIGATVHRNHGNDWACSAEDLFQGIPADAPVGGDKEEHIDALITRTKQWLGPERYRELFDEGLNSILANIRQDLKEFGVEYEDWFSERSLTESGAVDQAIERLKASGHVYEQEGALWFRSTDFGDEKDRVIVRDNGQKTYFASDIAYHMHKLERGYARVIDIWGADHHGYVPRVRAAIAALGEDPARLSIVLVQFAALVRGGAKVAMSTRSGEFVTLRELVDEVGAAAARFFYLMRRADQHLEFDLDLATTQNAENPVYYVQYAHARICSVERQLAGREFLPAADATAVSPLTAPAERRLAMMLWRYPEIVQHAALAREPHLVPQYLRELATEFHAYYNSHKILVEDAALRAARWYLAAGVRQVLANGLDLLGIAAPHEM